MGVDITLCVENQNTLFPNNYSTRDNEDRRRHDLSRLFSHFMCRQSLIDGEAELDQIGRITSIDIQPLYEMDAYLEDDSPAIEFMLQRAKTEKEKQTVWENVQRNRERLRGNIDKILLTINALIEKLSAMDDLSTMLDDNGEDTIGYEEYFTDFNGANKRNYETRFGDDLRNFKNFLEYAKDKGATTVYFLYG